jgi:hypothetical protein
LRACNCRVRSVRAGGTLRTCCALRPGGAYGACYACRTNRSCGASGTYGAISASGTLGALRASWAGAGTCSGTIGTRRALDTLGAGGAGGACGALRSVATSRAKVTLGAGHGTVGPCRTLRTCGTLRTGRPNWAGHVRDAIGTHRACGALRPHDPCAAIATDTGVTLVALGACRTEIAHGANGANRANRAGLSRVTLGADVTTPSHGRGMVENVVQRVLEVLVELFVCDVISHVRPW